MPATLLTPSSKQWASSPSDDFFQSPMARDPLGFAAGDTNLYRYCGNDPTNGTDPTGLVDLAAATVGPSRASHETIIALVNSRNNDGKPGKADAQGTFDLTAGSQNITDPAQQVLLGGLKKAWGFSINYDPPKSLALNPGENIIIALVTSSDGKGTGWGAYFDSGKTRGPTGYASHTLLPPYPGPGKCTAKGSVSLSDRPYNPRNTFGTHTEHVTAVAILQSTTPPYNVILGSLEFDFYDEIGKAKITLPNLPGGAVIIDETTTPLRTIKGIGAQNGGADLDTAIHQWNPKW